MTTATNAKGYSTASIIIHWMAAIAVIAMFFTHEKDVRYIHMSLGLFLGVFFWWRVLRRRKNGPTEKPAQPPLLNLASQIVIYGILIILTIQPITGYLLPWTGGRPFKAFGFEIASPLPKIEWLHETFEFIHDKAGHIIMLLVILHVLGALKHLIIDRDGVFMRMIKPVENGK